MTVLVKTTNASPAIIPTAVAKQGMTPYFRTKYHILKDKMKVIDLEHCTKRIASAVQIDISSNRADIIRIDEWYNNCRINKK